MQINAPLIDIYFLFTLRAKYNSILAHLREIVDLYDDLDSEQRKYYITQIDHIVKVIINITSDIQRNCIHEFVNDSIDIDCECSQNITYCTICEYTKP